MTLDDFIGIYIIMAIAFAVASALFISDVDNKIPEIDNVFDWFFYCLFWIIIMIKYFVKYIIKFFST